MKYVIYSSLSECLSKQLACKNVGPLYPRDLAYYVILFSPHPPTQGNEDTTVI